MKRIMSQKAYLVCTIIMSVFISILSGCGGGGGGSWTEPNTDTTRPTVSSVVPANTATGVFTNSKITTVFSEEMAPASISTTTYTVKQGANPVAGTIAYSGVTAVFTPASALAINTLYTVTVTTAAKDLAGNTLENNYVWSFTTGATADLVAPAITATINANGATGVPVNTKVGATFNKPMDPLTINSTTFTFKQGLTAVPGTVTYSGVNAVFTPTATLAANTLYTATITTGAKDLSVPGNALANNYVWSWTTGAILDTTKPTVTATINANGATGVPVNTKVGATFSEAMDPLSISTATFTFKQGATAVPGTVQFTGMNAVFTPTSALAPNTLYTATITTGAKDLAGNALMGNQTPLPPAASNYVWSWTTGAAPDTTPPTITLTFPADIATGVLLNAKVSATFSEPMDALTITNASFTVFEGINPVAGTVFYLSGIATFSPASALLPNTTYTAMVTTAVKDLAGNPLAAGAKPNPWSFTTGTGLAPGAIALGSAGTFGIMATSAITSTGNSVINGDVSLNPGTSMTGFPPAVVNGSIHINDTVSAQARADLLVAYNAAKALPPGTTIPAGADLGALYISGIPPGTYTSGSTMLVNTPLTLDAGGNANAVWVFQIGSSLTTGASITLANGAQAKNVFWVPTEDATVGVGTIFYGTIVSGRDVTAVTGATINGRILAGAITAGTIALQNATVNVPAP